MSTTGVALSLCRKHKICHSAAAGRAKWSPKATRRRTTSNECSNQANALVVRPTGYVDPASEPQKRSKCLLELVAEPPWPRKVTSSLTLEMTARQTPTSIRLLSNKSQKNEQGPRLTTPRSFIIRPKNYVGWSRVWAQTERFPAH